MFIRVIVAAEKENAGPQAGVFGITPGLLGGLGVGFTLLHEGVLGSAGQRLAILAHGLGFAVAGGGLGGGFRSFGSLRRLGGLGRGSGRGGSRSRWGGQL